MKRKSIITLLLFCMGLGMMTTSCEDMLSPDSERHSYEVAQDTLYSYWGILKSLQNVAEKYVVLGECRGDLVGGTSHVSDTINAILNFGQNGYAEQLKDGSSVYTCASDYYHIINSCNAYLAKCDTTITTGTNDKYMIKEYAQVEAIRAWVYLQLVQVYGEVPFYLEPLLTTDDIDAFNSNPNRQMANASNLADLLEPRLIPMEMIEKRDKEYIFPSYENYGRTSTVCHSSKCMFPVSLVLGDIYLLKGDDVSCAKAAQCYYNYLNTKTAGPLIGNDYYCRGNILEGVDDPVYGWTNTSSLSLNSSGGTYTSYVGPWTEKSRVSKYTEAITCIPSSTNKLWGTVLRDINRLFGFDATISVRTTGGSDDASTSAYVSLSRNFERELIASKGYEALCDSQKYEVYIGTSADPMTELVVLPDVGDARQYWVPEFVKMWGDDVEYGHFISKQNPGNSFTTVYPMIYRKATVWLRFAEAINRAGYPSYAFAVLKNGLCKNDNWYPDATFYTELDANDYAVKDTTWCIAYTNEDETVDTLRSATKSGLASLLMAKGVAEEDVDLTKAFGEAASTYNYPADHAQAVCYYLDKREVEKTKGVDFMNFNTEEMQSSTRTIPVNWKLDVYNRLVSSSSYPASTTGENYITIGVHQRGCGRIAFDERNSCYNYVDKVAERVKINHGVELTKADIYSGEYDSFVTEAVEDLIIEEMGLELAFEGTRFFDLSRVAMRRNDPSFFADHVARRNGQLDPSMYTTLLNPKNWYLPLPTEK